MALLAKYKLVGQYHFQLSMCKKIIRRDPKMSNKTSTIGILGILWTIPPLYAAYHDFQNGNILLAIADYIFFPLGLIRSIMFVLG